MAVVIQNSGPTARAWKSTMCDCCAAPGGCGNCCYTWFCSCCVAGEIAKAAGKDYCMSCCIVPFVLPCLMPCVWAWDRQAFSVKFGIPDEGCFTPCLLFYCGCGSCLLCQERNTLLAFQADGTVQQAAQGQGQTIIVVAGSPGQQQMGQAPAY